MSLSLNCFILGDDPDRIFTVEIPKNKNISILKDLIKEKKTPHLDHVAASDLDLWQISFPIDDLETELGNLNLARYPKLSPPSKKLTAFFTDAMDDCLHVIAKAPVGQEISIHTSRWIALKSASHFISSDGKPSSVPSAGSVLCLVDLAEMLNLSDSNPLSSIFIRDCYITWWNQFILHAGQDPHRKFALSSSPGCGKTVAANFIFKMATSHPLLRDKPILYQFKTDFFYIHLDNVSKVTRDVASNIAVRPDTFYLLDGLNADPLLSECMMLFISSPRNNNFKDWYYHKTITPLYFPIWSWDELRQCQKLCYQGISEKTIKSRYERYGGIARYVYWQPGDPPSLEAAVADSNARKSIRSVGEPSQLFPTSHMLLHIHVDEELQFEHVLLASRYVGTLLFSKYFEETLENLKSMLGGGGALAGHLFECYAHFLFEHGRDEPLTCRSLDSEEPYELTLHPRKCMVFDSVPQSLDLEDYFVPLRTNFAAADALIMGTAVQYTVTEIHKVKGVTIIQQLATLYGGQLPLLFVVPESIASDFPKQSILTAGGKAPAKLPTVRQFVAGLPLGIDAPPTKKRRTS